MPLCQCDCDISRRFMSMCLCVSIVFAQLHPLFVPFVCVCVCVCVNAAAGMHVMSVRARVPPSPEELMVACGTDMFAIQEEIAVLKSSLRTAELEIKQAQYVRGAVQAGTQTPWASGKFVPVCV